MSNFRKLRLFKIPSATSGWYLLANVRWKIIWFWRNGSAVITIKNLAKLATCYQMRRSFRRRKDGKKKDMHQRGVIVVKISYDTLQVFFVHWIFYTYINILMSFVRRLLVNWKPFKVNTRQKHFVFKFSTSWDHFSFNELMKTVQTYQPGVDNQFHVSFACI